MVWHKMSSFIKCSYRAKNRSRLNSLVQLTLGPLLSSTATLAPLLASPVGRVSLISSSWTSWPMASSRASGVSFSCSNIDCYFKRTRDFGFKRCKTLSPSDNSLQIMRKLCSLTRYEVFCSWSFGVSTTMASEE